MNFCQCPSCDFTWMSKMNPGGTTEDPECRGLYPVLCRMCLAEFVVPTRGPRGMMPGEVLELCTIEVLEWVEDEPWRAAYPKRTRLVRTGVCTIAADRSLPLKDMADFARLACPACAAPEAIRDMPDPGPCPACGGAELQWGAVE